MRAVAGALLLGAVLAFGPDVGSSDTGYQALIGAMTGLGGLGGLLIFCSFWGEDT